MCSFLSVIKVLSEWMALLSWTNPQCLKSVVQRNSFSLGSNHAPYQSQNDGVCQFCHKISPILCIWEESTQHVNQTELYVGLIKLGTHKQIYPLLCYVMPWSWFWQPWPCFNFKSRTLTLPQWNRGYLQLCDFVAISRSISMKTQTSLHTSMNFMADRWGIWKIRKWDMSSHPKIKWFHMSPFVISVHLNLY